MPFRLPKPWGARKPPVGSSVDWGDPISQGLVGYWLMNEGAGLYVRDIAKGNRGTLTNGPTWAASKFGNTVKFDGTDDYIKAGKNNAISGFPFTLCGWVENSVTDTAYRTILSIGSDTANRGWFNIQARSLSPTAIRFGMYADNNDLAGGSDDYQDLTNYNYGWHFVVGVFASATDRRLYIDGNLLASRTGSVTFNAAIATGSTYIGALDSRNSPIAWKYWFGKLDNLRLYNRALSQSEIQRLYTHPFAGIKTPIIGLRQSASSAVTQTLTHTTDALLKAAKTKTHTTDALLKVINIKTHTTDALLKVTNTKTHTTDSLLKATSTKTHTTDALLRITNIKTHTTDALLKATSTVTHTTDALLKKTNTKTHTTDAYLTTAKLVSHTIDALLKASSTKSHTTDSLLKKSNTLTHSTDAYIANSSPLYANADRTIVTAPNKIGRIVRPAWPSRTATARGTKSDRTIS